jgi:hypothetical protein
MPTPKTLFNAVETELKNARVAISNADRYLDAIKEVVEILEAKVRIVEDIEIIPTVKALQKGEDVLEALRPGGFRNMNEEEELRY